MADIENNVEQLAEHDQEASHQESRERTSEEDEEFLDPGIEPRERVCPHDAGLASNPERDASEDASNEHYPARAHDHVGPRIRESVSHLTSPLPAQMLRTTRIAPLRK